MDIGSLFFKKEPKREAPVEEVKQPAPVSVVPMYGAAPAVHHNQPIPMGASQDYNHLIEQALEEANQPNFDYFEFRLTLKGYDGKPIPDAQKYEYAYMNASVMKVTPQDLVASANYYKGVLQGMQSDFDHQLKESFDAEVARKEAQVSDMQKQIEKLTQESAKLAAEAQATKYQLEAEKAGFHYAHSAKMQEIENHIKNINTYLNATPKQQ